MVLGFTPEVPRWMRLANGVELHLQAGRRDDRLTYAAQEKAAVALGYVDTPEALAVDRYVRTGEGDLWLRFPPSQPLRKCVVGPFRKDWEHITGEMMDFVQTPPESVKRLSRLLFPRSVRQRVMRGLDRANIRYEARAPLDPELRAELERRFAPEVERLEALLGRPLPWPKPAPVRVP